MNMDYQFQSKVYTGESKGNKVFNTILLVVGIVIGLCLLIKILVGDFHFSDVRSIIFSLIIIGCSKLNIGAKPVSVDTTGQIHFNDEGMSIIYRNIPSSKKEGPYDETTFIRYADIETIELSRNLDCFRIVGNAEQRRFFQKTEEETVVQNPDKDRETFITVYFDEQQDELKDLLQKQTHFIVKEMEQETSEDCS